MSFSCQLDPANLEFPLECHFRVIAEDDDGHIDLTDLEHQLESHADRPLKIGTFSAASNVTGIITDVRSISVMLHKHGALSFWDFAAAAPATARLAIATTTPIAT